MKKIYTLFFVVALISVYGCDVEMLSTISKDEKTKSDSVVMYTIPSGSHYCTQSAYLSLQTSQIKFKARFDSTAVYKTLDKTNQEDINKLYGMSDCGDDHQINSARFGWRWFKNTLEIWAYSYVNGERKFAFVRSVPLNSEHTYQITFTDTKYIFNVDGSEISLPRHCQAEAKGYKLYPYFGGDETAPHKITIEIEDLK